MHGALPERAAQVLVKVTETVVAVAEPPTVVADHVGPPAQADVGPVAVEGADAVAVVAAEHVVAVVDLAQPHVHVVAWPVVGAVAAVVRAPPVLPVVVPEAVQARVVAWTVGAQCVVGRDVEK